MRGSRSRSPAQPPATIFNYHSFLPPSSSLQSPPSQKIRQFVAPREAARPCRIREGRALQAITGLGMEAMESPSRGGGTFISSHLLRLPTETRTKVFASAASCQALLRILSPIARHYCLRACFSGEVGEDVVANWSTSRKNQGNLKVSNGDHRRAVESLLDLGVWKKVFKDGGKQATYKVNERFAEKLRLILQSGVRSVWSEPTEVARRMLPDAEELRRLSQRRWDSVLLFLAGGDGQNTGSGPLNLEEVLTRLGLLERTESSVGSKRKRDGDEEGGGGDGTDTESEGGAAGPRPALRTTPEGYQFLLRPAEEQVWRIVGEFLSVQCGLDGESGAAAVSFLLQLGFCEEGKVCKLSVLSGGGGDAIARVARALATLGLVYPFESPESPGEFWVLPTHLSKLLCGGPGTGGGQGPAPFSVLGEGEGIIVETNYRVYAYTKSPLRRAVLELFCLQEYVLPNLFVGRLARESCSAAFEAGISAELIVDYLNRNAHPQVHVVRSGAPVLPETVADGVRLWEVEARRLSMSECAMYDKFESRSLFLESLGHAKDHGKVLWVDEAEMKMVVQLDHHNSMKAFIKEAKMKL